MQYLYLHGFASGLRSQKLQFFKQQFQTLGLMLHTPDLNQGDFRHLTLTRQLQQVEALISAHSSPFTIIGSSFGGLTAAWLAARQPQVEQLVLMAPAFQFAANWVPRLGAAQVQEWQQQGTLEVYHYDAQTSLLLEYEFLADLERYCDQDLQTPTPTLIFHGQQDEIVPISVSQTYAAERPWVTLTEMASDHSLRDVVPAIWQQMLAFLNLPA